MEGTAAAEAVVTDRRIRTRNKVVVCMIRALAIHTRNKLPIPMHINNLQRRSQRMGVDNSREEDMIIGMMGNRQSLMVVEEATVRSKVC